MGGTSTKIDRDIKRWPVVLSQEDYLTRPDTIVMASYPKNETFRQGIGAPFLEFQSKYSHDYLDVTRIEYTADKNACCQDKFVFKPSDDGANVYTCDPLSRNPQHHYCDSVMEKVCFDEEYIDRCLLWIPSTLNKKDSRIHKFCTPEKNRNDPRCVVYFTSMKSESQSKSAIVDRIYDNYSSEVKKEYLCAFPPTHVLKDQEDTSVPYECWYKPCALSPLHKLSAKNITKQRQCSINICDIHIQDLQTKHSDIQIACQKAFVKTKFFAKDSATFIDRELPFLVPDFDIFIPLMVTLLFLYI